MMKRYSHLILFLICLLLSFQQTNSETEAELETSISIEAELCLGIEEHLPLGKFKTITNDIEKVYLWTKISGLTDPTYIIHKWLYNNREMASIKLLVKSNSWRTWSSKKLLPEYIGKWEVQIIDDDDNILKSLSFEILKKEG